MDDFEIMSKVCNEILKDKRTEKFKNIDTIDLIQELSERINSNLYVFFNVSADAKIYALRYSLGLHDALQITIN